MVVSNAPAGEYTRTVVAPLPVTNKSPAQSTAIPSPPLPATKSEAAPSEPSLITVNFFKPALFALTYNVFSSGESVTPLGGVGASAIALTVRAGGGVTRYKRSPPCGLALF